MNTLRIYFPAHWRDASTSCEWALCGDSGTLLQQGQTPLADIPKADDYVAIISSERVLCRSVKMPAGSRRHWQAALPFIAEEYTMSDPEENHVIPGTIQEDGTLPLLIVDKLWLQDIINTCHSLSITLRHAIPEMLLSMRPESRHWTIVWDGRNGFVRTGPASAMSLDIGNEHEAPITLRLALLAPNQVPPSALELRFTPHPDENEQTPPQWPDLPMPLHKGKLWNWRHEPIAKDAPDLLWGRFAPRPKLSEWLPKLRPLALILFAALSIEVIGTNIEWAMLVHEREEVSSRMTRIFQDTFGENSSIVNAPLQMQRNLSDLRHSVGLTDDADFLPLLDRASPALTALPAGSLRTLNYESGQLELSLRLSKTDDFNSLQERLQDNGLEVRMGKVVSLSNAVETKFLLRRESRR